MEKKRKVMQNCTVVLGQIPLLNEYILRGYDFDGCDLYGPAVLALVQDVTIDTCGIDGNEDAVLWAIEAGRKVIGAIAVEDCTFTNCTFSHIGLAVNQATAEKFRASMATGSPLLDEVRTMVNNLTFEDD